MSVAHARLRRVRTRRSFPRARSALIVTAALVCAAAAATQAAASTVLFTDDFARPGANGVLTNEYAYWNPLDTLAPRDVNWDMTSGTLFSAAGSQAASGVPDTCDAVDRYSQSCNNSAVFRLNTKRADFGDVKVEFDLLSRGLSTTASTPAVDWDGVHIWLRYQSEYNLYYASVNRRDNHVVIKKKCAGGASNGGTYYELGNEVSATPWPVGSWQHVAADVKNNAGGSVTINLYRDGALLDTATDSGVGCAPITHAGSVGIRGDNDNIVVDNFVVTDPTGTTTTPDPAPAATDPPPVTADPPPPADPPAAPALQNPSLETADAADTPSCWRRSSSGTNSSVWTHTVDAHTGGYAERMRVSSISSGSVKFLSQQDGGACAPGATPGAGYVVSAWYKADARPRLIAYYRNTAGAWKLLGQSALLSKSSTSWARAQWTAPALPSDAVAVSVGFSMNRVGKLTMDDFSVASGM